MFEEEAGKKKTGEVHFSKNKTSYHRWTSEIGQSFFSNFNETEK